MHQNVAGRSISAASDLKHSDESRRVISDSHHSSVKVPLSQMKSITTETGGHDGHLGLDVEADSSSGLESLTVTGMAARSRSAQDLSRQSELLSQSPHHHRSAESLLDEDRPRTLLQVDRLRLEDSGHRRRSFGGTLRKAASAVALRCRGFRDSLKAASSDGFSQHVATHS